MTNPAVGIVIPIFRHSVLVTEAVDSALAQDLDPRVHIVAVNDGCPYPQTHETLCEYALAHGDQLDYVRQSNRGLSGARNTGVRHLLRRFPSIEAIYFLDADNQIEPGALRRALAKLRANPRTGFVYPDINMFGLRWFGDFSGNYSPLMHMRLNVSEAGSLVRADVFRDGVFFDEDMKLGYEDWDFFLSAYEAGFHGAHLENFGFRYRKRAESMVSESHGLDTELRATIARKHKQLFHPGNVVALEAAHHPRYALIHPTRDAVSLITDPDDRPTDISMAEFQRRIWASIVDPTTQDLPSFVIFADVSSLRSVKRAGMQHFALWRMERLLDQADVATVEICHSDSWGVTGPFSPKDNPKWRSQADMVMIRSNTLRELARRVNDKVLDSLWRKRPRLKVKTARIFTPHARSATARRRSMSALRPLVNDLKASSYADARALPSQWKNAGQKNRFHMAHEARMLLGAPAPIAPRRRSSNQRDIAFVLPLFSFGGVERTTAQIARQLKAHGWRTHLVVWQSDTAPGLTALADAFDSVSFLDLPDVTTWSEDELYYGTEIPGWQNAHKDHAIPVGLLAGMDAVVFSNCASGNVIAGKLRRFGVKTLNYLHVADFSEYGRPVGHPMLGLAYEHVYDAFLTCSQTMADWLGGMGVPPAKLIVASNAPGFDIDPDRAEGAVRARTHRQGGPLRILFIGRLDRQKGLERLLSVVHSLSTKHPGQFQFRVVGAQLVDVERVDPFRSESNIEWCEATFDTNALSDHYAWADALLLLSHWEGLPLSIIEAQNFGAVPIATNVGGVAEAIKDQATGFLIDPNHPVAAAMAALEQLALDRSTLMSMALAAARAGQERRWRESVVELIDWLNKHVSLAANVGPEDSRAQAA